MLASGKLVTATPTKNTDLWKALQGGSGSFGIVTSITVPTIAKCNVWWGYLVLWNFDIKNATKMMHKLLTRNGPRSTDVAKDVYGAGPLLCHGCAETGRQTSAVILVHTKPGDERGWPATFKTAFGSLWRIWSQFRVDPLSKALGFIASTSLYGERRHFATLTVKNDLDTLHEAYAIHVDTVKSLFVDKKKIKGLSYNFVVQPLPPVSVPEGEVGPMGFTSADNEPLALLLITVGWADAEDDDLINGCSKKTIERWQQMALAKGTLHPYIYLNYAADWQKPFESYGKDWLEFMRGVSKKHDETGLFQAGRSGGFKLFE
ncbi:hypothetical protein VHEMI04052 [[Torrubiella] hemipterigena]|uniref:Berberine/berberine-like domain-containing protein n=1 Tax=[Torrubiella] hemipterigena TaxID=1531966 RepID=A0A0A1TD31_9HYPO|nr:hypothetical protein VHEMI04052 [[Torrubiella] hemipterigena]